MSQPVYCMFTRLLKLNIQVIFSVFLFSFAQKRRPHYFPSCSLVLRSVHPCPCKMMPRAVTLVSCSGSWPVPLNSPLGLYLHFPLTWDPHRASPHSVGLFLPFQPGDTAVGLVLCGFAPSNCTQIMPPTGRKINILNVITRSCSVQYGKEREIWFWKAVHPDCLLNAELATLGDFRL